MGVIFLLPRWSQLQARHEEGLLSLERRRKEKRYGGVGQQLRPRKRARRLLGFGWRSTRRMGRIKKKGSAVRFKEIHDFQFSCNFGRIAINTSYFDQFNLNRPSPFETQTNGTH